MPSGVNGRQFAGIQLIGVWITEESAMEKSRGENVGGKKSL